MVASKLILLLTAAVLSSAAPTAHVVVIFGQSNSVGFNSDGRTSEDVTFPNILQTSCCNNGQTNNDQCQLILGDDPLHHQCDTGYVNGQTVGFGMSFARALRTIIAQDDIIVLVPAGIGGTGFVDNVWTAYTGTGFQQALKRIQNTFALIAQKYPQHTAALAGYLWHQGEADAGTSTMDYLSKDIIPMINAWRNTTLIPQTNAQVPFVVGNLVPEWVEDPNQTVRLGVWGAIQSLSQLVPYSATTPSRGLHGGATDQIHFTAKSHRNFGKRYFISYLAAQLNSDN